MAGRFEYPHDACVGAVSVSDDAAKATERSGTMRMKEALYVSVAAIAIAMMWAGAVVNFHRARPVDPALVWVQVVHLHHSSR